MPITPAGLHELQGRYVSGPDTLDINAGAGYLYAAANRLNVSTTVMFFPQDRGHLTGCDPATRALTRLEFSRAGRRSLSIELANGRRLSLPPRRIP